MISVFQIDSPIVKDAFDKLNNYLIINNPENASKNNKLCVIYFSGHSIYYPNNSEAFNNEILLKDRYEWFGIRFPNASKHIFLRDIHKQWYLTGINSKISSPEKLLEFLKKETHNYKVICIGSSAGGYASLLFGSYLNAEIIYAFSPQIELNSLLSLTDELINPLIFRLKDTTLRSYYDITKEIGISNSQTIICYPVNSQWDNREYDYLKTTEIISKRNIHILKFNTSKHGVPFPKVALEKFFLHTSKRIDFNEGIIHNPIKFSIQLVGLKKTLLGSFRQIKKYIFNKVNNFIKIKLRRNQ